MYKNLRIVFTVLSAICLAAAIPLGMFFDFVGLIGSLLGAGIFFVLMLLCKQSQEFAEAKQKKPSATPEQDSADNGAENADDGENAKTVSEKQDTPPKKIYRYKRKKK